MASIAPCMAHRTSSQTRGGSVRAVQLLCLPPVRLAGLRLAKGDGDRASTKADKLRKLLGCHSGILHSTGDKPKDMYCKTYQRLNIYHDALLQISLQGMERKLGILYKLLDR